MHGGTLEKGRDQNLKMRDKDQQTTAAQDVLIFVVDRHVRLAAAALLDSEIPDPPLNVPATEFSVWMPVFLC